MVGAAKGPRRKHSRKGRKKGIRGPILRVAASGRGGGVEARAWAPAKDAQF